MVWRIALCVVAGYLLGGVNGAIVVSHALMKDDVRSKGSGNAGLTNYLRNYGGRATFLVAACGCCPQTRRSARWSPVRRRRWDIFSPYSINSMAERASSAPERWL